MDAYDRYITGELATVTIVVPLGREDLGALRTLYRHYPGGVFRADHLEHGAFYDAYLDEQLIAAGGTHIVAERYGLGVLGRIFTHPAWRGRGYGTALTSAIVLALFARGCTDAMLTVGVANAPAIRLYSTLGFAVHCRYWSGTATLLKVGMRRQW
jgi:GNAT superfamily N-acetyltransferase